MSEDEMLVWDGFDDAIIGTAQSWTGGALIERICYDGEKMVGMLEEQGMDRVEAEEHIQFNVIGGYIGEMTPVIMWKALKEELFGGSQ